MVRVFGTSAELAVVILEPTGNLISFLCGHQPLPDKIFANPHLLGTLVLQQCFNLAGVEITELDCFFPEAHSTPTMAENLGHLGF